ncbi:hypothetical protein [Paenibacillus polymyxa]|uniref:hypothetical protein n=1 Tax=Paenibacillus polymyxa TaxID=1406 RepID=UPI00287F6B4C|nr:hypothetical protein [Paenibacillus polymyxa]
MINITEKCANRDGYQMIYVNTDSQQGEMSNNEWQKDISKHLSIYQSIKDKEEISFNELSKLSAEDISFWIKVVNTDCYNTSNVLIELTLQYVNKEVTYYISREAYNKIINQSEIKTKKRIHMDNNLLLIDKVNELQGVSTIPLNMFNLHELHIDNVPAAGIRIKNGKVSVIPYLKVVVEVGKSFSVSVEKFKEMIERYRDLDYMYTH